MPATRFEPASTLVRVVHIQANMEGTLRMGIDIGYDVRQPCRPRATLEELMMLGDSRYVGGRTYASGVPKPCPR